MDRIIVLQANETKYTTHHYHKMCALNIQNVRQKYDFQQMVLEISTLFFCLVDIYCFLLLYPDVLC